MGNVQPKRISHIDDDADFAASFVLNRADVDDALAASPAEPSSDAAPPSKPSPRPRKILYVAFAAVAVLAAAVLLWLGR